MEVRRAKHDAVAQPVRVSKGKFHRVYPDGNLLEVISRVESMEELKALRETVLEMADNFSMRTKKRVQTAMNIRYGVLSTRLIQTPPSGKILVPTHLAKGSTLVDVQGQPIK